MTTYRQRFENILEGHTPESRLGVSRLDIWFKANSAAGTLPDEVRGLPVEAVEARLGMGRSARRARVFRIEYDSVEEETCREGDYVRHRFVTPLGEVSCKWQHSEEQRTQGLIRTLVEPYLKAERDYDIMAFVERNTRYVPDYDAYREYDEEIGDDGLPLVVLHECPMHKIMVDYAGYGDFYYHLADWPARVQALHEVMSESYRQMWDVVAASPACFLLHGAHFSSDMTPPPIFEQYFMPYFSAFNRRMHDAGMRVAFHADADLTGLLEMVRDCEFDVADTYACAPLVRMTLEETRACWQDKVVIWGGVPSIILEPDYPEDAFESYLQDLDVATKGWSHFIVGVSDNVLPAADWGRLKRMSSVLL